MEPMSRDQAYSIVQHLLQCFPVVNLTNPDVYMAEVCALFAGYPWWAGLAVLDAAKFAFKFPPALAELRPLLEDQVRYVRHAAEFRKGNWDALLTQPREKRPTYDELKAKYGENWGIDQGTKKETVEQTNARWASQVQSWDEIKQFYEKNPERWNNLIRPREAGLK